MSAPPSLAKGDQVKLTWHGIEHPGAIILCSENFEAIAVEFDGLIGGYFNMVPLLWDAHGGTYRTIAGQVPVTVERVHHA